MATNYNAPIPYDSVLGYDGLPPVVTAENLPSLSLRVTDKEGNVSALPEANIESVSFEFEGPGAISFSVAEGTVGYSYVDDYSVVDLLINGEDIENGRWLLRNTKWNEGILNRPKSFSGKSLLWDRLERTRIWDNKRYKYDDETPGNILNDIFAEAQSRGALGAYFTWTFDQSVDSLGNAWPQVCSFEYLTGAKYSDIVANMLDRDLIDISLVGNEILVVVKGKRGNVRDALLVVGEDVTDAPQQSTTEGVVSDVIIVGDEGIIVKRTNPVTASIWGREEDNISQGGTQDIGTLSIIGDAALSAGTGPRIQRTYALVVNQERKFLPIRDYMPGDWIRVEHGSSGSLSLRVVSVVLKRASAGDGWEGAVVLNDKFLDSEIRLAKKVAGILGGATIVGSSMPAPDDVLDTGIPNAPTGLTVDFEQYTDDAGYTKSVLLAGWNFVTGNTDGTFANDIAEYRFVWKYSDWDDDHAQVVVATGNQVALSPVDINRDVTAYVYVVDNAGNRSGNSNVVTANSGTDTEPPPQLTMPAMTSRLHTITISWDGLAEGGGSLPPDFKHAEVWVSDIFNVPETNLVGTLSAAGDLVIVATMYELFSEVYAKLIPVDTNGNRGPESFINSVVVEGIQGDDLEENSVTANIIAAGAVGAVHVNAGALDTARLSLGPTMNLVVDPSFNLPEWRAARDSIKWAENPLRWHFTTGFIDRNGYYLQALSDASGINGGRMYMTDWIQTQYGETYYAAIYLRDGQFAPNSLARMFLGWEVTRANGEIIGGGTSYDPSGTWTKCGYNLPIDDLSWVRIRFYVRADNLNSGDIAIDDWEVRSAVGTTAVAGPRITLTPPRFEAFNTSEQQTVLIEAETGDVRIRGELFSGFSGKRIEVNPGSTYLPEIRFKPTTGEAYAYINAVDGGGGATPFIGVNAPDNDPTGSFKVVLTDDHMYIGQFDTTIVNTGTGVVGDQGDGYLYLIGRMSSAPWNVRGMLTGGRFTTINGAGSANGTTTITVNKPTMNGLSIPIAQAMRATDIFFRTHLRGNSSTIWTFRWENYISDGVTTWTDWILFRGDDI